MRQQNRRFCTLPDLASPRESKNTDRIDDTMIMMSASSESETDMASTAHLFKRVQTNNRRRYRAILSLVSTMTLIATAVAVISVTVKKMSNKNNSESSSDNKDDSLWFNRNTLAPVDRPPTNDGEDDPVNVDTFFTSPPIFGTIDVTAPPALAPGITRKPTPNINTGSSGGHDIGNTHQNDDEEPSLGAFTFPPISTVRRPTSAPSASPVVTLAPVETLDGMKRPSLLDLTHPPRPPTNKPTRRPRPTSTSAPTVSPTNEVVPVPDTNRPTQAPFSPFLDIVRPGTQPSRAPVRNETGLDKPDRPLVVDDDDDDFAYLDPTAAPSPAVTEETATDKPTRTRRTDRPTEGPTTDTTMEEEDTEAPTLPPTLRPRRTRRPSTAPTTMVPTETAPVTSTLAPVVTPTTDTPTTPTSTEEPTKVPTSSPPTRLPTTDEPTEKPTDRPTPSPTNGPTKKITDKPTDSPTPNPTDKVTAEPTDSPTDSPTAKATPDSTDSPTPDPTEEAIVTTNNNDNLVVEDVTITVATPIDDRDISYLPGDLTHMENGLLLSKGLTAKIIATAGQKVTYASTYGGASAKAFHSRPDAGACFVDTRASNKGGWVYVSNSEMRPEDPPGGKNNGGVGAITFDANGDIKNYDMVLSQTTWNCGGGRTPWNTWVSCEEAPDGVIWQVDPMGEREPQQLTMGSYGGRWESFAFDISDMNAPHYFVTEDHVRGALIRYTPARSEIDWQKPWDMLHGSGTTDYLLLTPNGSGTGGTYEWVPERERGRENAALHYPNCEGIDSDGEILYFVSKKLQALFELNLRDNTYTVESTIRGLMDGRPDQVARILTNGNGEHHVDDILYFTEEGGVDAGVHGRDSSGNFFTILESPTYKDETSGLAFSPDGKHMYIAYQENGVLLDVTRLDGLPFHAKSLNVKYHAKKR